NEIYPKFYGEGETILADVFPYDHGKEVLKAAGGMAAMRDEFRIGRSGLINLLSLGRRARWQLPLAEDVFFAWLRDKGFKAELSPCGRVAKEVYTQLSGWLAWMTNEPVIKLLDQMTKSGEDGKGVALGEVKRRLKEVDSAGNLYNALVRKGVFQLGYKTQ